MSETGPGPSPEELEVEAEADPEEAAAPANTQAQRAQFSEFLNAPPDQRDTVLRNAQGYLYEREQRPDKESLFRETRTQRLGRALKRYTTKGVRDFPWGNEQLNKRLPQEHMERLEYTPLDHALIIASDPEKYDAFIKTEREKGEGKEDRRTMERVAIFHKAVELRTQAARLIDEQRRGVTPDRAAEIDAQLNQAYLEIMLLAHTRSFQAEPQYDETAKRTKVDRSIKQGPNETDAEWRARAQGTKVEKKLKDVKIAFQDPLDPSQRNTFRRSEQQWHRDWVEKVASGERKEGNGAGFRKPIETKGDLTPETVEAMEPIKDQLVGIIDDLALGDIDPEDLEQRYGIRVSVQKREDAKVFQFGKGAANRIRATQAREITLRLADGSFAHFGLSPKGFLREKGDKVEIVHQPSSKQRFSEEEYIRYQQTVLRPQGTEQFPFPTLILTDPDPTMLQRDPAYNQLLEVLERVVRDYPNAHQEAERKKQEAAVAERQEALENDAETVPIQDDD